MSYLVVSGGRKLKGEIENQPSKNSAVAILCACAMIKGRTKLLNVPEIEEVKRIVELLNSIGVKTKWVDKRSIEVDASGDIDFSKLNKTAVESVRSSILLWGALAGRIKEYKLYKSGGCRLGERTVRPHWYALEKFGIKIESKEDFYAVKNPNKLVAGKVIMYESGDTTTENAIMAAVLAKGTTTIKMASANYMVQDLCFFLNKAGAEIKNIGNTTLEITGVDSLNSVDDYSIMPDPIIAMTFISAAITTCSNVIIKNCPLEFLELELEKLSVMGQKFQIKNDRYSDNGQFKIVDIEILPSKLTALPDKIYGRPFPGLNIDNLPLFIPFLTQAHGRTLVHDWAYENRSVYSLELQKLGANISLLDPHRVLVEGPAALRSNEVICPPALRPAVNVLICMLAAQGESILRNTYVIDRGYENLYEILNKAGAKIQIKNDN